MTALSTTANGNPVKTLFGGIVGKPSVDMSASAVSSYGNGLSNAGGFNTIILNDLSQSFSSEMANQRTADNAILNCISSGTNGNGSVGLTSFDGDPYMWNPTGAALFPIQLTYVASPYVPYCTTSYANTLVKATIDQRRDDDDRISTARSIIAAPRTVRRAPDRISPAVCIRRSSS